MIIASSLLIVAVLFGGGGTPSPLSELVVQLAALAALATWLILPPRSAPHPIDRWLLISFGLFLTLPLFQLIPLPPALWHALPGRATAIQALQLVGQENGWRPLSLDPYRTLAAALSLIPPAVMFFFVSRLGLGGRTALLAVVVALSLAAALVGMVQLASGDANWLRFYANTNYGFATGFQANRNHQADLLLHGIMALGAVCALRRDRLRSPIGIAVCAALFTYLGCSLLLTGSRTGIALILVAAVACVAMMRPRIRQWRSLLIAVVAGGVVLGVAALAVRDNAMIEQTISRFSATGDARTSDLWPDSVFALDQYWPVGSGMGTFIPVFQAAERLEVVDDSMPNRAHNDYLELAIEAGLFGIGILLFLAVVCTVRIVSIIVRLRSVRGWTHGVYCAGSGLVFALHSMVDYPMRSMALAVLAGMSLGLISFHEKGVRAVSGVGDQDAD